MEKQTAIEWLIEQLIPKDQHEGIMDIIKQAKEMEHEEAENKLVDELIGFQIFLKDLGFITDVDWGWEDAAKQYNETYKNKQL
jgi:hypothetical protein